MIRSFRDKETKKIYEGRLSKRIPREIHQRAIVKLDHIASAERIEDLRMPPGNRLEQLRGDRRGQWSIRINQQYRICFTWVDGHAEDVEIVDYH